MAKKTKKTNASETGDALEGADTPKSVEDQTPSEAPPSQDIDSNLDTSPAEADSSQDGSTSEPEGVADAPVTGETAADQPDATEPSEPIAEGGDDTQASTEDIAQSDLTTEIATEVADAEVISESGLSTSEKPASDDPGSDAETGPKSPWDDGDKAEPTSDAGEDTVPASETETSEPVMMPAPVPQDTQEKKSGVLPMVLGGVAAAVIGYGAADLAQPGGFFDTGPAAEAPDPFEEEARAALSDANDRLSALEGQEAGLDASALDPLMEQLGAVTAQINALTSDLATLSEGQAALDARLVDLAQAPIADNVSEAAIAAYEAELAALQSDIAAQRAAMQETMDTQRSEIEGLAEAAAAREAEAQALAQEAQVQSAAAALIVQIETGAPFTDALAAYQAAGGGAVDPVLSDLASEGVPKLEALQESFPDAARAALVLVRDPSADASDGAGGLGTFLARQLQIRSTTPREGDDPDAVLSRAEAAVRAGDLTTALDEINALPEVARTALADWEATATARRDALAAATALTAPALEN